MELDYKFCCDGPTNQLEEPFEEEQKENYINEFFAGIITITALSNAYHKRVTRNLMSPVIRNIGDPDIIQDPVRLEMATAMRRNIFEFSAAKQYQQARAMSALITPDVSFEDFKRGADRIFGLYNENFLRTEFDTAVASSQNAASFVDAMETAEDFPLIQYVTQRDDRVRPAHRSLDGITLPVTHNFWRRYWPPNGWNCRCFIIKLESGNESDLSKADFQDIRDNTPELFRQNPALTGLLFDRTRHPYFDVAAGDSQLRENNFNLPRE